MEDRRLYTSWRALEQRDTDFFAERLPRSEYYRIALSFPDETLFLDIETTGLSRYYDKITLIGWAFGGKYNVMVRGQDPSKFLEALGNAKAVVTFNGSLFDIPFLRNEFEGITFPKCHIDLRFFVRRVGIRGGQKIVEEALGFQRPEEIREVRGETAAVLWYKHKWGERNALEQLIRYNRADIEGMKFIFDETVGRLVNRSGLPIDGEMPRKFFTATDKQAFESIEIPDVLIRSDRQKEDERAVRLSDLYRDPSKADIRIVGLDLTGSEARASGWCLLEHRSAETRLISTDNEIIRATIDARPNLISIDSPLSLPVGRKTVADNDLGREKYGITRHCERVLRGRGINVYPCLIPSMQRLTARGMMLATHFRKRGFAVIESYPGAAQDIMMIPRKRASLEYLAKGLEAFGIEGDFTKKPVSHDELDAITSAIVGHFFWSGRFEALGNDEEEHLIIPDLTKETFDWWGRKVIGLSGPISSGKSTIGQILVDYGFAYGRFSLVLKRLLEERDIESNREELQRIGMEVNKNPGQRWLGKQLIGMLPSKGNIVIDGLRFPEDHALMKETYGPAFLHITIRSDQENLMARYMTNEGSRTEFHKAIKHNVESEIIDLSRLADFTIENDESFEVFKQKAVDMIRTNVMR